MGSICRLKNATKNDKQCGLINIDHLKLVQYKNEKRAQTNYIAFILDRARATRMTIIWILKVNVLVKEGHAQISNEP